MILAVDFDGTIVKHRFPAIGDPVPGAIESLKLFKKLGVTLILLTMRSDGQKYGDVLTQAVEYCREHGVEFDYVNESPRQKEWTSSPKVYTHYYIDDAAIGCPLRTEQGEKPWADWRFIAPRILSMLAEEQREEQETARRPWTSSRQNGAGK